MPSSPPAIPRPAAMLRPSRQPRSARIARLATLLLGAWLPWLAMHGGSAPLAVDETSAWPRIRDTNGSRVTFYLPQVEHWTSNSFRARAVVEVREAGAKRDLSGVIWFEAEGRADRAADRVTLDRFDIVKGRFPEAIDGGSNALALVRLTLPSGARTVSFDYLVTALGFEQAAARQGPAGLKHAPPEIVWATNRTVLVVIDGKPVLRPIPERPLERVINTPALLVRDPAGDRFYLAGDGRWFTARTLDDAWALVQNPPAALNGLDPGAETAPAAGSESPLPRILVRTHPTELLMTAGLPDYRPIAGTKLMYAADTDSALFFHSAERQSYLLLSGRWFKAGSLHGPWTHVPPSALPPDFARIPAGSPQGLVLASVPETPQAELALLANAVPTCATVKRSEAKLTVTYDGAPEFRPVEGTSLRYAINARLPVIQSGAKYYAVDRAVWFAGSSAMGPWEVATEVPEEIYTIPPQSPVYYATFVRIYRADDESVEVGYTPGYQGSYEEDGTVVYGTGWEYESWTGTEYLGWGWTYCYGYVYPPWYQWWLWRPWWNPPGGLRGALIENIYERWNGTPGVTPYDAPGGGRLRAAANNNGFPALYGRFAGASHPAALAAPANTLAVNPYQRPKGTPRPGEAPAGAQLLSAVRRASGGGRDLYASPDGNVYRRQSNGWYRQRPGGGGWDFAAPLPGTPARGKPSIGDGSGPRGVARIPNTGFQPGAQDIAALERQYYARSLAQMRARAVRTQPASVRPVRTGGGRRR